MTLGLDGTAVQSVLVEYSVRMQLSDGSVIVIESPLTLNTPDESFAISPEDDNEQALEPIHQLVGRSVDHATAASSGALRVTFDDGAILDVQPDAAYEAWSVAGPNGALVVCTAGGKLAVWSAQPNANAEGTTPTGN
jgi:phage baseplate assembly protein gpV